MFCLLVDAGKARGVGVTNPDIPPATPEQVQAVHRRRTRLPAGLSEAELLQGYAVPVVPVQATQPEVE